MGQQYIKVNGRMATDFASHTFPVRETILNGGMGAASWTWNLPPHAAPPGVKKGALVEIGEDGHPDYLGRIESIDPNTWAVTCTGIQNDLAGIPALGPGGVLTRDVQVALVNARTSPWNADVVKNAYGVTGTVLGDNTEPIMVAHLFELLAEQGAMHWGVDADANVYMVTTPTQPTLRLSGRGLNLTDKGGDTYNMYAGRYRVSSGVYATAYSMPPTNGERVRSANVDLTKRGTLSALDATVILTNLVQATRTAIAWEGGLEVTSRDLRTLGWQPASTVKAGDVVRLQLTAPQRAYTESPQLDVPLGSVTRTGPESWTIAPLGSVPTTIQGALEAMA